MSDLKTILTISVPEHLNPSMSSEVLTTQSMDCTYCSGLGYFNEVVNREETKKNKCPVCNGCAKIKAQITISWMPASKNL